MKKILVAEDSSTMRLFVRMSMRHLSGISITEASDGLDAIERIREQRFDLIITDINMPRMDGLQLIENVRMMGLSTPIIILTTLGEEVDRERGIKLGANSYVTKPIIGAQLSNLVTNYVNLAA